MVAGVVAIVTLVFSVWLVGDRTTGRLNQSLLSGCARAVSRDQESWATNRDLAAFAHDAARARRAEGDEQVAVRYEARAASAEARMVQIKRRLPASDDVATVAVFCRHLFPG
jgi:hypothetical protein